MEVLLHNLLILRISFPCVLYGVAFLLFVHDDNKLQFESLLAMTPLQSTRNEKNKKVVGPPPVPAGVSDLMDVDDERYHHGVDGSIYET